MLVKFLILFAHNLNHISQILVNILDKFSQILEGFWSQNHYRFGKNLIHCGQNIKTVDDKHKNVAQNVEYFYTNYEHSCLVSNILVKIYKILVKMSNIYN